MVVSFEKIQIGEIYERSCLIELWGYKGVEAISRGIVTPSDVSFIVLFVTENKGPQQPEYKDEIIGSILVMDGETSGQSDSRLIASKEAEDQIHLFYREETRQPFTYLGEVKLLDYQKKEDSPTRFVFQMQEH